MDVDRWRITYALPEPVRALRFLVPEYASRVAHWHFLEPEGLKLVGPVSKPPEGERLSRANDAAFTRAVVELTSDTEKPEKAYQPTIRFADSGVLFFTGQLNVVPCVDEATCAPEGAVQTRFTFVPLTAERVVVSGGDGNAPARWMGPDQGTYVYFGALTPVATSYLAAVVDRGFPKWLRTRVDDMLPKLFEYYARRTGHASATRPLVFMSYGDEPRPGSRVINGGTLPGVIQQEVRLGADFRAENDSVVAAEVMHSVAHEVAHWWNGRMFANNAEERGGSWLHEGGADAFADRALRDLNIESRDAYHWRLSEALSLCSIGLRDYPLSGSSRPGRYKTYYTCGAVIGLWTEAATAKAESTEDLLAFWKHLFDSAIDGGYDDALYYRTLASRAPDVALQIQHFVEDRIADPAETLTAALTANGVGLAVDDSAATPAYARLVAIRAAEIVAAGDACNEVYVEMQSGAVVLIGAAGCRTLPRRAAIAAIGGVSLAREGARAWDIIAPRCAAALTMDVMLSGETRPRKVACPQIIPRRTPYLRVTHAPFD